MTEERGDLVLYTITTDDTLRIFLPVIDTPSFLQLHATLDQYSAALDPSDAQRTNWHSNIFWLHHDTLADSFMAILSDKGASSEDTQMRRIKEMNDGGWDCFARIFPDGSIVVRAVAVKKITLFVW